VGAFVVDARRRVAIGGVVLKLVFIVYQDPDALDRFVRAVAKEGVAGVTFFPSSGIGRKPERTAEEFQFGFGTAFESRFAKHTTLFSIVMEERLARLLELMRLHLPEIDRPGGGLYAVLDVAQAGGVL
jgi:hypothetical protein